jgi:hypothetical protein
LKPKKKKIRKKKYMIAMDPFYSHKIHIKCWFDSRTPDVRSSLNWHTQWYTEWFCMLEILTQLSSMSFERRKNTQSERFPLFFSDYRNLSKRREQWKQLADALKVHQQQFVLSLFRPQPYLSLESTTGDYYVEPPISRRTFLDSFN